MSSDSAGALGAEPPSPKGLQELIDALKTACSEVVAARRQVEDDCKAQVEQFRVDAGRSIASAHAAAEGHQRDLRLAVETASARFDNLEERAGALAERLKGDLAESKNARSRVQVGLDAIASAMQQIRVDRETWDARGRAAEARHEAAVQQLRLALAAERARVTALEAANKRLLEAHSALEERLTKLEKKKVFGLF